MTFLKLLFITESNNAIYLNHIGTSTFENCKNLKEILLPDTLSSIGENAFKGCSVLKAINIPGNVKEIGDSAFEECVSLDEITIPHSIVLGKGVFCSCTALKTVIFEADPELSKIQIMHLRIVSV